ncbi:Uncharacterised protein [Mycobacteroides abscessus]|nr:Uncharacterised protein [Mycobacteroides abscessus]
MLTWRVAVPRVSTSPSSRSSSVSPRVRRFSPNAPGGRSAPSSSRHAA